MSIERQVTETILINNNLRLVTDRKQHTVKIYDANESRNHVVVKGEEELSDLIAVLKEIKLS